MAEELILTDAEKKFILKKRKEAEERATLHVDLKLVMKNYPTLPFMLKLFGLGSVENANVKTSSVCVKAVKFKDLYYFEECYDKRSHHHDFEGTVYTFKKLKTFLGKKAYCEDVIDSYYRDKYVTIDLLVVNNRVIDVDCDIFGRSFSNYRYYNHTCDYEFSLLDRRGVFHVYKDAVFYLKYYYYCVLDFFRSSIPYENEIRRYIRKCKDYVTKRNFFSDDPKVTELLKGKIEYEKLISDMAAIELK